MLCTCGVRLGQTGHGDLRRCDGGGRQSQARQRVEDKVGLHRRVGGRHQLAARVGDEAGVDTQGLGEKAALLEGLLEERRVDLEEKTLFEAKVQNKGRLRGKRRTELKRRRISFNYWYMMMRSSND